MACDRTAPRLLFALLLAAFVPACNETTTEEETGGGGLTAPSPGNNLVFTANDVAIGPAADLQRPAIVSRDVPIPASGRIRVEADWLSELNDIDIVVAKNDCRSGIAAWNNDCTVFNIDRSSLTKPARVDFDLRDPETLRIYLYNFSTTAE